MHDAEVAKALGQVTPGYASSVAVEHRIHEQTVVTRSGSGLPGLAGQQVLDAFPMHIGQGISSGHVKSYGFWTLTFKYKGKLIDDTP